VTLSNALTLTLTSQTSSPYLTGAAATFQVTVTTGSGAPVSGIAVTLTVTGANAQPLTGTSDAAGHVPFSYTGTVRGADTLQASTTVNGGSTSGTLSAFWLTPANSITTTLVTSQFFNSTTCASGCEPFNITPGTTPAFTQNFPNINFANSRPFADTVVDGTGAAVGTIIAPVGTGFSAVLRGSFIVTASGQSTLSITAQDGFILGIGNGATRVSGVMTNPPASTPFSQYPVIAANNGPSTGSATPIVVNFPAPGVYPYEFDYRSGTGGALALSVPVRPLNSLALTSNNNVTRPTNQPSSFTVQAKDETGAAIPNLALTVTVSGANAQTILATTNSSGVAPKATPAQTSAPTPSKSPRPSTARPPSPIKPASPG
jgi:hypothetical protein